MSHPCIPGSVDTTVGVIQRVDPSSVLLIVGGTSFEASGAEPAVSKAVEGLRVNEVRGVPSDPSVADVSSAIGVFRDHQPDLVVAVGGGSVIDVAKAVRSIGPLSHDPLPYLLDEVPVGQGPPLLAIPTTAGTGSEATRYAVFNVDGEKRPIAHAALRPDYVILDPELTASVPQPIAAATGFDALAQAMESMWSTRSTGTSYTDARVALQLALEHLESVVNRPTPAARLAMCRAAHLAGHAIDVSPTTAPHALSFHLTTDYGVPHGHAVALTLGPVLEFNAGVTLDDCADPRGPDHVRSVIDDIIGILGARTPPEARRRLTDLLSDVGLESRLAKVGVRTPDQVEALAARASPIRLATNPRKLDRSSLVALVSGID